MSDIMTYRGIGNSISTRASLLSELRIKLAQQDEYDQTLRKRLLEKAPQELEPWLTEDMVLTALFQYGRYSGKIKFGDYGFKNVADTRSKISSLKKAWEDVVAIELDKEPESHRIAVRFSALM